MLGEICSSVMCAPLRPLVVRTKSAVAFMRGAPIDDAYAGNARLTRWIAETMSALHPSRAFICGAAMAPYLETYRFVTRATDMREVSSEKWRRHAEASHWPLNEFYWRQERALLALEMRVATQSDHTLFASAAEANLFARRAPRTPAHLVTMRNGVDHEHFNSKHHFVNPYPAGRKIVLFAGAMDYPPNIEGATWFATEVMTMLRHRFPTIDFWIVGEHPTHAVRALARRDIHVVRSANDIRPYLAHADAVVVPLRVARGVENNVLEAMAMAKLVVATPAALDGLNFTLGEEVLGSASAPGFASGVATALSGRAGTMGERAYRRIEADYGWLATLRPLDTLFMDSETTRAHAS